MLRRALGWLLAFGLLLAGCEGDAPPPPSVAAPPLIPPEPTVARIMGTGAMTPLVRELVRAFPRPTDGKAPASAVTLVVEASVGSGGGVQAAADGAIDLGMISRPLRDTERAHGLLVVPVALEAVALAAHRLVPVDGLDRATFLALATEPDPRFSDGTPAVVLLRDREESANEAFERLVPELRAVREEAYRTHRLRVLYHDDAMAEALAATPGAIGLFPLGAITTGKLPLKVLALDSVRASTETLANGTWRATRPVAFVLRPDRLPRVRAFLSFVASPEGRRITIEAGYHPTPPESTP